MVRVGLIGCGVVSARHLQAFAKEAGRATITAVCDTDPEKARAAVELAPAATLLTDYRAVLADPAIDAVDLCLPHHLHRAVTIEALSAGKQVLCEKPIATTLADADAMIAAAEATGRVLMIAEHCRFEPLVPAAQELLASGVIGEPIVAQTSMTWVQGGVYLGTAWRFDPATMGGGVLMDSGIHRLDTLVHLLGRPVEVACLTRRVRDVFPTEDTALVTVRFASGVLGELLMCGSTSCGSDHLFRVVGTHGGLTARHGGIEVVGERVEGGRLVHPVPPVNGTEAEVTHFLDCLETGRRPLMGGAEARLDLELVLACYESVATGRIIDLPLGAPA